jgi:hypothetical protein
MNVTEKSVVPRGRSTLKCRSSFDGTRSLDLPQSHVIVASFLGYPQISRPAARGASLSVKINGKYQYNAPSLSRTRIKV